MLLTLTLFDEERMSTNKYAVELTPYEYSFLNKNQLISAICRKQLGSATTYEQDDEKVVELSAWLKLD